MRVSPSVLKQIKHRENWQELVREAIAEKLKKLESQPTLG